MIHNEKGHILLQILIVILFIGLLFTILYPNKVWKEEAELANVCQTRMETIRQMEFFYLSDNQAFNDTIPLVVQTVLNNPEFDTALDTLMQWDNLVTGNELKEIVLAADLPAELNSLLKKKINSGSTLSHLSSWDTFRSDLLNKLQEIIATDSVGMIDSCVTWAELLGSNKLFAIVNDADMSEYRKRLVRKAILNSDPLHETRGWDDIKPILVDTLGKMIQLAQTENTWEADQKSRWEDQALVKWEKKMNALPDSAKMKLWEENKDVFWDKERDIVWRKDRTRLWNKESEAWIQNNESVWKRILEQRWKIDTKKSWLEETKASLPDSLVENFNANRDSLWGVYFEETEKQLAWEAEQKSGLSDSALAVFETQKDSLWKPILEEIQNERFEVWLAENEKEVEEVIESLWESERMLSWQPEAYDRWLKNRESNMDKTWEDLKEELWKTEQLELWQAEEEKLATKKGTYRRIDSSVQWDKLLSQKEVDEIVNGLDLPDSKELWDIISNWERDKGLPVVELGIAGLFKEELLEDLSICPVARVPYLLEINNESRLKTIAVKCPIVDKDEANKYAITLQTVPVLDDSTNEVVSTRIDTTQIDIAVSPVKKIFGGAKIMNHGNIDSEGKKSWEKRGQ